MSERVDERMEEIRQKWADDIRVLAEKPDACIDGAWEDTADVRDLLTALAQAERERDRAEENLRVAEENFQREQAETRAEVERLREEMRQALEPGTAPRIVAGMFSEAEKRGMSPFSAKHALVWLCEQLDAARAEVERLTGALREMTHFAGVEGAKKRLAEDALARVRAQLKACEERNQ